jgi:hypothetical protein
MRNTHARALGAGMGWRPVADSERDAPAPRTATRDWPPRPTRALDPPRPAVQRLNQAGAGDNLADVVDAYAAVAEAAWGLADALQAAGD